MKHVIALLAGFVTGVFAFILLMYNNPFTAAQKVSPLAVTKQRLINLQYSVVPEDVILFTHDGESVGIPQPESVQDLWESTIKDTTIMVTALTGARGEPAGVGIKFSSDSEDTRLLNSEVMVDSVWHVYMPDLGTLFVDQRENVWPYVRDIVTGARVNSADSWHGKWIGVMTTGPNALGTGRAFGGSGLLAGIDSEAVETISATAYSSETGPVAMDGSLVIALPDTGSNQVSQAN